MSKIARIYQGTNEIQKYYQRGVLQRLFFDWKHYIGTELNIEYAKECAGRNIVISGKTTVQGVPSDYTILDYIECTGTQHIDTGFKANTTTTKFVGAFTPTQKVMGALLGSRNNSMTGTHSCNVFVLDNGRFRVDWANGSYTAEVNYEVGTKYKMEITRGRFVINDTIKSFTDSTSVDQLRNFLIGNFNSNTTPYANGFVGYIHECKLYSNDVLVRNFVPAIRNSDNEVGMYDTVTKTFYTNAGVDSFIAGEKVVNDDIESVGEKEGNLVTIRNYNYKCETDNIVLPDGTKNSIEIIDGKKVHVQRVWKSPQISIDVFQGSQNTSTSFEFTFTFEVKKPVVPDIKKVLYDKGFFYLNDNTKKHRITIQFSNNRVALWVRVTKEEFPTAQDVKYFFKNNPMYVYIELKEPIYTYLESGLYDNITLPSSEIKNEIYLDNDKWYHKRNIGRIVFDGSDDEEWEKERINGITRFYIKLQDSKYSSSRSPVYVEGYKYIGTSGIKEDKQAFLSGTSSGTSKFNYLYIYNFDYTNLENGFKTYLAENPLEVYYELAESVITELYYNDINYKLDEPLRSLPNGICDTIEGNKLVQRVGKVVLDGSDDENWGTSSIIPQEETMIFQSPLITKTVKPNSYLLSNKFNHISGWNDTETITMSGTGKVRLYVGINRNKLDTEDLNTFRTWLSENPVTVYYELATPIETPITPDMILINGEPITDTVGIELPNGTKDSIENGCYVKRVGKVIIDGNKGSYTKSGTSSSNLGVYVVRYLGINITLKVPNTNYIYQSDSDIDMSKYITVGRWIRDKTSGSVVFKVPTEEYLWSDIHNAFLENPITLYVELATPVKIPLFSIKEGLTTLKSTNNITPQIELDCLVRDGFQNMCDNEWESGDIDLNTGTIDNTNSSRIRLINYIKVKSNTKYRMDVVNSVETLNKGYIEARYYDNEKSYLDMGGSIGTISKSSIVFTTPEDCCYIRFIAETTDVNFKIYLKEVF